MPILAEVLGTLIGKLALGFDITNVNSARLDQFLGEKVPQSYVVDS